VQYSFIRLGIIRVPKVKMAILNHVSTVLKPGRTTLVLGPPGAGKSSLLKAMAGKLEHHGLNVRLPTPLSALFSCVLHM
jgi:ABC-type multidrug transport system ATPase subunit